MQNPSLNYIHESAKIGENVKVDPFATIGENVSIGSGTWIGSNVVIYSNVTIGKNCKIFPGAVIGADPQDLKYAGEETFVEIGDNVMIRECCTINKGTKAYGRTVVESNTLLMAYVHIAHDCHVKNNCIIANAVNLAGHVIVGEYVGIGGMTAIQQFVNIGDHSYITGGSLVRKNVPPYVKAAREPLSYVGVNRIGLERRGYSLESINRIQNIYRVLFVKGWSITRAIEYINDTFPESPERNQILEFIGNSEKGLMRGFQSIIDAD
ncbi:MAG: acyl-ACP--UDP-N-acetylglucosamine O-acyltransferase [Bacteroidia bacterium]|nr:acyl-ACP--UDP-N-acetylglucosamine O-acyltransferase [Bacteroidia bacterium]